MRPIPAFGLVGEGGPAAILSRRVFSFHSCRKYIASAHNPTMPISSAVIHPSALVLTEFVDERLSRLVQRCRESGVAFYDDAGVADQLKRVLLASDFAYDSFLREPTLLGPTLIGLISNPRTADARAHELAHIATDDAARGRALRRFRRRESLRLIWRDVNGLDSVAATLAGSSTLAEVCLETALRWSESALSARYGLPRDSAGNAQRMVVLGLGKLGGSELNFSSDIDLILAYAENGQTDGERMLDNETFFARVAQQVVRLLAEVTADGFAYRIDLRLRPFGSAGRIALSFAAMEQYYQRDGRDWERYAWIKARPVAGDIHAGERLIESLRPFVYRRYFDYTAFAGLREMKALIDAEVVRKDLAQHLKLGPGGIREIEFIVQLQQLIRGGREPSLRARGLLPALTVCEQLGMLTSARAKRLRDGYNFLRRLENRVQMMRDEQTHELPDDAMLRQRLARALDYADWSALMLQVDVVRSAVSEEFSALMDTPRDTMPAGQVTPLAMYWQQLVNGQAEVGSLAAAGYRDAADLHAALEGLLLSPAVRSMSPRARARLDRLMPSLLEAAVASQAPDVCLARLLKLLHAIARRSAYLALLDEQPVARQRLVDVFASSALLADRVIAHPLLLDELFDSRNDADIADSHGVRVELARRLAILPEHDTEVEIEVVQEEKHSAAFRLGLACLKQQQDARSTARGLSDLAETVVAVVLDLAERDAIHQHGRLNGYTGSGAGMAVLGYGSLGGAELGFASDLDLVFLYDGALVNSESDGAKPLDGMRYYARLAQRVVHLLTTLTRAGRLYEIDVRLRPDGGKGLLVTSLQAFTEYQRERAWTWEHQALVRARHVAGDTALCKRFAEVRADILQQPRDSVRLHAEINSMRVRWRTERDRSTPTQLDLKQGVGALLDIEFLLQALVLEHATRQPALLAHSNSAALIAAMAACGVLPSESAAALSEAHARLLATALACTLDARPRLAPRSAELATSARAVIDVVQSVGLDFVSPVVPTR